VYLGVYTIDVSSVVSILEHNDEVSRADLSYGNINEVQSWKQTEEGYVVRVSGNYSTVVDIPYGEIIYHCEKQADDWYSMRVADNSLFWSDSGIEGDICLTDSGFSVGDTTYESLPTVEVLMTNENGCRLRVSTGYDCTLENLEVNYCRSLPTDRVYFNKVTSSLIRNVDSSFAETFLVQTKFMFMFYAVSLCAVFVAFLYKQWNVAVKFCVLSAFLMIIFAMLTYLVLG